MMKYKKISVPDILNKAVLDTLITGKFVQNELSLGITQQNFYEIYGQPTEKVRNALKSFQDIIIYFYGNQYEEQASYIALWFEGDKLDKPKKYKLRTIEFVFPHIKHFTKKKMKSLLGEPDLEYLSGYQMHYCYGNVIFMFTKISNKWQLTNIRYQDDAYVNEHRILFDK